MIFIREELKTKRKITNDNFKPIIICKLSKILKLRVNKLNALTNSWKWPISIERLLQIKNSLKIRANMLAQRYCKQVYAHSKTIRSYTTIGKTKGRQKQRTRKNSKSNKLKTFWWRKRNRVWRIYTKRWNNLRNTSNKLWPTFKTHCEKRKRCKVTIREN